MNAVKHQIPNVLISSPLLYFYNHSWWIALHITNRGLCLPKFEKLDFFVKQWKQFIFCWTGEFRKNGKKKKKNLALCCPANLCQFRSQLLVYFSFFSRMISGSVGVFNLFHFIFIIIWFLLLAVWLSFLYFMPLICFSYLWEGMVVI